MLASVSAVSEYVCASEVSVSADPHMCIYTHTCIHVSHACMHVWRYRNESNTQCAPQFLSSFPRV
jgi:hypothetical protein